MTGILLIAGVLPQNVMNTRWFAVLSMFVAINTLLYLTLAIIKMLPKAYLSDWIDQRNRRAESRSIWPMSEPELRGNGASPAPSVSDARPTDQPCGCGSRRSPARRAPTSPRSPPNRGELRCHVSTINRLAPARGRLGRPKWGKLDPSNQPNP